MIAATQKPKPSSPAVEPPYVIEFHKRYFTGLEELLSGNSLGDFAKALEVPLPATERVWLGRRGASLGG